MVWIIILIIAIAIVIFLIKPYVCKVDTVVAYTGGLGSGKSFCSSLTAVRLLRKNRFKTFVYNVFHPKKRLQKPLLYSSIPIRISKKEMSTILTPEMLTLQEGLVKGSVVFLDEVDVFANQFAYANENIIECSNKKDLAKKRDGDLEYDSGLFDEEIRLFRHLFSSPACECKLVCNTQATSNITTIIRRRMNTVYVLSRFRVYNLLLFKLYTVNVRNITITDEITNVSGKHAEDDTSILFGIVPRKRLYDTHCYRHRADTLPITDNAPTYKKMDTTRLLKAPIERLKNKSYTE